MLTGEMPFPGTPLGVIFRIAYQGLERDAIRELPGSAQTVFQRSLAKRPAERYATCGEMVETLAGALLRHAPAATRLADAGQFAPIRTPAPPAAQPSWAARNFSREAVKYFGVTFVVCALILAGIFYLLLPKSPPRVAPLSQTPAPVAPVVIQPAAPAAAPPSPAVVAPPASSAKAKAIKPEPKSRAKKKEEPEVELKPAEPKIIRP
jgi:hypothetical protein